MDLRQHEAASPDVGTSPYIIQKKSWRMKIQLLSPAGNIHRSRDGIFKTSLRYAPLTLTTLAALVPDELDADIAIQDEGVQSLNLDFEADLVGITAITGTANRSYEIADRLRDRGHTVVLGGVHPTLLPEEASAHADAVVIGYAEQSWPQLLRDFVRGEMKSRYIPTGPSTLENLPRPRRDLLKRSDTRRLIRSRRHVVARTASPFSRFPQPGPILTFTVQSNR